MAYHISINMNMTKSLIGIANGPPGVPEVEMEPALHVSLNVSDIARARDFYAAFFGVAPAKEKPGYVKFVTSSPALHLALNEARPKPDPAGSLSHLGIRVASTGEVDEWKARATDRGVASFDERDTTCCYARQDKFWVSDPDGNRWEVYTVLEDVEVPQAPAEPEPVACCAPTCCA
jgi:catechol 2,3-dioxygenase-like lactoylglutathione lyase family enzyme